MNEKAVAKQEEPVAAALAQGARLLCGGGRHSLGPLFYEPTVLAGLPDKATIMCEETFWPVAALTPFADEAAVVRPANATEYGRVPYLHTPDPPRTYRMNPAVEFGMLARNRTEETGSALPSRGVKHNA